jgi:hypothetical protein
MTKNRSLNWKVSGFFLIALSAFIIGHSSNGLSEQSDARCAPTSIAYISGGATEREMGDLRALSGHYNLHLSFASTHGSSVSEVGVTIVTLSGTSLLNIHTEGPLMYVRLPAGRYVITSRFGQSAQTKSITVSNEGSLQMSYVFQDI